MNFLFVQFKKAYYYPSRNFDGRFNCFVIPFLFYTKITGKNYTIYRDKKEDKIILLREIHSNGFRFLISFYEQLMFNVDRFR